MPLRNGLENSSQFWTKSTFARLGFALFVNSSFTKHWNSRKRGGFTVWNMATAAKSYEQYRSLQPVGGDEPKDYKMYTSQELAKSHKQSKLISSGVFSLIILITGIMFLLGVLIGYYVNESHHSPCLDLQNITSQKNIDSLHNNVMFYISGDRMIKTVRYVYIICRFYAFKWFLKLVSNFVYRRDRCGCALVKVKGS